MIEVFYLNLLNNISIISALFPLLISIIRINQIPKPLIPVFVLVIIGVLTELINKIYMDLGMNNSYIFHFYTIIEFALFSLFYILFFKDFFNPKVFYLMGFIFLAVAFIDYKIHGLNAIDNVSISMESIILTCYSLFLFFFILKNLTFNNLLNASVFWINTGILVYFAGNLLLFVFSKYLIDTAPKIHLILWAIVHSFLNILNNILIAIAFWKTKANQL